MTPLQRLGQRLGQPMPPPAPRRAGTSPLVPGAADPQHEVHGFSLYLASQLLAHFPEGAIE